MITDYRVRTYSQLSETQSTELVVYSMTDFIILLYVHFSHSHRAKRDPRHFCFAILPTVFRYHNIIPYSSYST